MRSSTLRQKLEFKSCLVFPLCLICHAPQLQSHSIRGTQYCNSSDQFSWISWSIFIPRQTSLRLFSGHHTVGNVCVQIYVFHGNKWLYFHNTSLAVKSELYRTAYCSHSSLAAEWTKRKQNAFIVATVVHREIDVMCIDAQSQCRTIIHSVAVTRWWNESCLRFVLEPALTGVIVTRFLVIAQVPSTMKGNMLWHISCTNNPLVSVSTLITALRDSRFLCRTKEPSSPSPWDVLTCIVPANGGKGTVGATKSHGSLILGHPESKSKEVLAPNLTDNCNTFHNVANGWDEARGILMTME